MTRHLATMQIPLDTLKRAAKIVDGTVNDAYLAAVTGGLHRYHERHHVAVTSLRALMPINLRSGADTNWGNKITLQRLTVPVAEPDPAARMRALHRAPSQARAEPSLAVTGTIAGALNLLPVGYVAGILKHVDFLASNVPGAPVPVYLAGAKVTGMFAFGPTIGASVNTTLMSYNGSCDIGINIDTAAVPDPDVLVACLRESFAEITALGDGDPFPRVTVSPHRASLQPVARGHVQGRVAVEEPERLEPERDDVAGHHRPVLRPGDVVDAEHVPEHHVGVLDGPVRRGPDRQARVMLAQVREVAAGPALVLAVGRHPERVADHLALLKAGEAGSSRGGNAAEGTSL